LSKIPVTEKELELWRAFHPQSHVDPEFEEVVKKHNRLRLVEEYFPRDLDFRKGVLALAKKMKKDKFVPEKLVEELDDLIARTECRVIAKTVDDAEKRFEEREKKMIRLREVFR
jgi:hypothetical protein